MSRFELFFLFACFFEVSTTSERFAHLEPMKIYAEVRRAIPESLKHLPIQGQSMKFVYMWPEVNKTFLVTQISKNMKIPFTRKEIDFCKSLGDIVSVVWWKRTREFEQKQENRISALGLAESTI